VDGDEIGVTAPEFSALVLAGSFIAGGLGALTGLGGGVVIVPLLTLVFHVDLRYAIGASLISVIATSSGSAAAYVRDGYSNVRIGLFLEMATSLGAIVGAAIAMLVPTHGLAILFGVVLLYSAFAAKPHDDIAIEKNGNAKSLATRFKLNGAFPSQTDHGWTHYSVVRVPLGFTIMLIAGVLSGLLGIGSGAVKVLAMDQAMRIPFKVSTTTSNFMIGVTAAASAGIYLKRGYVEPGLAMPVMLGVLAGSLVGARMLMAASVSRLRLIFRTVILILALEMIYNGATGRI
jgi:uncharacterized membrane protein YfcA